MRRSLLYLSYFLCFLNVLSLPGCSKPHQPHLTIGSKFFTEQVILAELLAQHIEARTGIHVDRKSNLGGTLLCQKALLSGDLDLYVEYTGTALTAVLNESPSRDPRDVYTRVQQGYAQRLNLRNTSDIVPYAPKMRAGFGYEFLERPDGFSGWSQLYGLHFAAPPSVMDLGLIYRALVDKKVDIVAGNSTDGLIDALHLVPLVDDKHYFPPYDAVPVVRRDALAKFPQLRDALSDLANNISAEEMRHLNSEVDANQHDPAVVVRAFRASKSL